MPTHSDLKTYERILRRNDNALRLRASMEGPTVLVERKTRRGRIGALGPGGIVWRPDAGSRYENGHVSVCSIPFDLFDFPTLRDALRSADTWRKWDRGARPSYERAEEEDARMRARKVRARKEGIRYKTEDLWNRYVWKYRQRIAVPEKIA